MKEKEMDDIPITINNMHSQFNSILYFFFFPPASVSFATSFLSPPFSFYMQMRVYSNHESQRATAGGIFIIKDKEVGSIAEFLVFFSSQS